MILVRFDIPVAMAPVASQGVFAPGIQGGPRLMYQNQRGDDQPWNVRRRNGHAHVHDGRIRR